MSVTTRQQFIKHRILWKTYSNFENLKLDEAAQDKIRLINSSTKYKQKMEKNKPSRIT